MTQARVVAVDWAARRLAIEVDEAFEDVVARYEDAVPMYPAGRFDRLVAEDAGWPAVQELTDEVAGHGFLIYWRLAADELMRVAGDAGRCRAYLMGNHTIAERMYRHDLAAMLYAPLRTVVTQSPGGPVRFTVDQPSRQFASLGDLSIAAVGVELDRKLAALLDALQLPVPHCLVDEAGAPAGG